jgi:hypothetical protein
MAKNFSYKIIDTKPLKEGIEFILNIPNNKNRFNRKKAIAILANQNTTCVCCGVIGSKFCLGEDNSGGKHWDLYTDDDIALTIDHILPKARGGTNHISNLQIMCLECNNLKLHHPERIEGYKKLLDLMKDSGLEVLVTLKKVPYLRIGYWKQLSSDVFSQVQDYFHEEKIEDEDCGWLYTYYFKH